MAGGGVIGRGGDGSILRTSSLNCLYRNSKTIVEKLKARGEIIQWIGVKPLPLAPLGLQWGKTPPQRSAVAGIDSHTPSLLGRGLPWPIGDIPC